MRGRNIITYQIDSGKAAVITHRIIEVRVTQSGHRVFTTKEDNNSLADPNPVERFQIKGELPYAVRLVGFAAYAVGRTGPSVLAADDALKLTNDGVNYSAFAAGQLFPHVDGFVPGESRTGP